MKQSTFYYLLRRGVIGGGGSASPVPGLISAFEARVASDGGSVESSSCLATDLTFLTENP
jgi:hypothetical protein